MSYGHVVLATATAGAATKLVLHSGPSILSMFRPDIECDFFCVSLRNSNSFYLANTKINAIGPLSTVIIEKKMHWHFIFAISELCDLTQVGELFSGSGARFGSARHANQVVQGAEPSPKPEPSSSFGSCRQFKWCAIFRIQEDESSVDTLVFDYL